MSGKGHWAGTMEDRSHFLGSVPRDTKPLHKEDSFSVTFLFLQNPMENESCFPLNPVLVLKVHDDSFREQILTCSTPSQTTSNPRTVPKVDR